MQHNLTLLTDLYELTMMNGFLLNNKETDKAVFDLFFRTQEENSYCIAAGLQQVVEYINNLHFTEDDIKYLDSLKLFSNVFLDKLTNYKFSGSIYAVPEGTVVFANEPLIVVEANLFEAQLIESALLNIVNFQTLIATKAARVCSVANGDVIEFGLRRAQAPDAAIYGARAAVIGGCTGTSNVLAAQMFGLSPKGTHAHSWIMSFDSELESFRAYANIYPANCLLLVDTYDTLNSGVPNAIIVLNELKAKGYKPTGIRLDSGDLAYLSKKARAMLDDAGLTEAKIFVSGDLDEFTISSLVAQGAKIDMYGVGTRLITSYTNPSLGGVYKMSALTVNGKYIPKMKVSDNPVKMTNPSRKKVIRLIDKSNNKALADIIALYDEHINDKKEYTLIHPVDRWKTKVVDNFYCVELLVPIFIDGIQVYNLPSINEITANTKANLNLLWNEYLRIDKPQIYKVNLSEKLYKLKQSLLIEHKSSI